MKVAYVNYSDISGGAARGAYRLHRGLIEAGIDSRCFVRNRILNDPTVVESGGEFSKSLGHIGHFVSQRILGLQKSEYPGLRNLNIFGSAIAKDVISYAPDILQLHWIGYDTISISQLKRFKMPIVWRLADMWAFTGTEHYVPDDFHARFRSGYGADNRPGLSRGIDIDRYIWAYKRSQWRGLPITFVTGSKWLADCLADSCLFSKNRIEVIPSGIDLSIFRPTSKSTSRNIFGIKEDAKVIMFSAQNALHDPRKGFQYLYRSLKRNFKGYKDILLVVLGHNGDPPVPNFDFPTVYLGQLWDDHSLALAYSVADVFVAPSVQDNLPFSVMEATACGVPVVAFSLGGLPEMIKHLETGYLAKPYCVDDLSSGISWALGNIGSEEIAESARGHAERNYSVKSQVDNYCSLYRSLLASI